MGTYMYIHKMVNLFTTYLQARCVWNGKDMWEVGETRGMWVRHVGRGWDVWNAGRMPGVRAGRVGRGRDAWDAGELGGQNAWG